MTTLNLHDTEPRRLAINWGIVIPTVLTLASWIGGAVVYASSNTHDLDKRVQVLETLRPEDSRRLERLEQKVDQLLQRP